MFSPKIGRRLSLGSYDAFRTWLAIEANPAIESFTERPADAGGTILRALAVGFAQGAGESRTMGF